MWGWGDSHVPLRLREEPSEVDPTLGEAVSASVLEVTPLEAPRKAEGEEMPPMGKTSLLSWAQQHLKLLLGNFLRRDL